MRAELTRNEANDKSSRLRAKTLPGQGLRLWSLERIEAMNRRAVNIAFPLLTVGLLVGVILTMHRDAAAQVWTTGKVIGTAGLWIVFVLLLVLRYGLHTRGRLLALGTIGAFVVMLATLAATHPFLGGLP